MNVPSLIFFIIKDNEKWGVSRVVWSRINLIFTQSTETHSTCESKHLIKHEIITKLTSFISMVEVIT